MQISVTIQGQQEVLKLLKRTMDGVTDLRRPLTEGAKYVTRYFSGVAYVSRGSVFGNRWPALSPGYERQKLRKFGSRPMLIASGKMQGGYDYSVRPMSATIFNRDPKFRFHQLGTARMPRRATMGVNDTLLREVNKIVNEHVRRELAKAV